MELYSQFEDVNTHGDDWYHQGTLNSDELFLQLALHQFFGEDAADDDCSWWAHMKKCGIHRDVQEAIMEEEFRSVRLTSKVCCLAG